MVLHSALAYAVVPIPNLIWAVHDTAAHPAFDVLCWWTLGISSPFYLISGFFAIALCESRGLRAFVVNRAQRIGGPFLVAGLTLLPATFFIWVFGWLISERCTMREILRMKFHAKGYQQNLYGPAHLWSLEYLAVMLAAFAIFVWLRGLGKARSHRPAQSPGWIDRVLASPWRPFYLAVPTTLVLWLGHRFVGLDSLLDRMNSFVPEPFRFLHNAIFFVVGVRLHRRRHNLLEFASHGWTYLALSVPVFACRACLSNPISCALRRCGRCGSRRIGRPLLLAAHVWFSELGAGHAQPPSTGTQLPRRQFLLGLSDPSPDRGSAAGRFTPSTDSRGMEVPHCSVGHDGTDPGKLPAHGAPHLPRAPGCTGSETGLVGRSPRDRTFRFLLGRRHLGGWQDEARESWTVRGRPQVQTRDHQEVERGESTAQEGAKVIMMMIHFDQNVRFLLRKQSTGFVMALLTSCAVLLTACTPSSREAEAHAVDAVKRLGGTIDQKPEDPGESVGKVDLTGSPITDDDLRALHGFTELHNLVLRRTRITDAGLAHLKTMHKLRVLDLDETGVTDVGLAHLAELNSLRGLYLAKTGVTDAGLPALGSMKKLREIGLRGTAVTDAGLASLHELADLRIVDFRDTQVTEPGVASSERSEHAPEGLPGYHEDYRDTSRRASTRGAGSQDLSLIS